MTTAMKRYAELSYVIVPQCSKAAIVPDGVKMSVWTR